VIVFALENTCNFVSIFISSFCGLSLVMGQSIFYLDLFSPKVSLFFYHFEGLLIIPFFEYCSRSSLQQLLHRQIIKKLGMNIRSQKISCSMEFPNPKERLKLMLP
jgi:hypothetical protein